MKAVIQRVSEARVTVEYLEKFWESMVKPVALAMQHLRREVESVNQIPMPKSTAEACNAYGGCPFRDICPSSAA